MTAGLISLPFAYANYQKKKAAYDAALAKYESLKDVAEELVDNYQEILQEFQDRLVHADENGDYAQYDNAPGLKAYAELQVGMLVGKAMNCRAILVIKNENKQGQSWTIAPNTIMMKFNLLGMDFPYIPGYKGGGKSFAWRTEYDFLDVESDNGGWTIKPGGRVVLTSYGFPKEQELLSKGQMKLLRNTICSFAGKKLITSVKSGTYVSGERKYEDVEILTADVSFDRLYRVQSIQEPIRSTKWMGKAEMVGLEYEGEAFYPAEDYHRELIRDALSKMF